MKWVFGVRAQSYGRVGMAEMKKRERT